MGKLLNELKFSISVLVNSFWTAFETYDNLHRTEISGKQLKSVAELTSTQSNEFKQMLRVGPLMTERKYFFE